MADNEFTIDTNITGSLGITGEIVIDERADHISTPTAAKGILWVKNTTPATLIFTDDAGTDATVGAAGAGFDSTTITGKTQVTPVSGDFIIGTDASDSDNLKKFDIADILGAGGGITDGDTLSTGLTFPNTGLHILDTNASHDLIIAPGTNLTADRTLTVTTGDSNRTLTLTGDTSLTGTNSGDVSLAGTPDYITISGQTITRGAVDLAADVTGTLPVGNGGTGATTFTDAGVLIGNGSGAVQVTGAGTSGQVLTSNGAGVDPTFEDATGGGDVSDGDTLSTGLTFPIAGLHILDTNGSHDLIISPGSDLTADRTLTIATGDSDRTLAIAGTASVTGTNTGDQTITLTGEVTGTGTGTFAATVDKTAITGKTQVTAVGTDEVLITDASDSGNLKRALISDFANATHTGDVTGATSTTLASVAITGKSAATLVAGDSILFSDASDSGNLKKTTAADIVLAVTSTDNAVARFNSTAGQVQDSVVTIADTTGNMAGVGTVNTHTIPGGTGTFALIAATQTLTNKRVTARTDTTTSSATPTINTDNVDYYSITALAAAITSFTSNLSGTPTTNQKLWIAITDDGTARAITWGASFEASGNVALPTTTVISTRLDVGFVWNETTSKWRCVAYA